MANPAECIAIEFDRVSCMQLHETTLLLVAELVARSKAEAGLAAGAVARSCCGRTELGTDLVTALSGLDVNNLAHCREERGTERQTEESQRLTRGRGRGGSRGAALLHCPLLRV